MGRLVLFDNLASTNAHKVRFLLAELGLDYEQRVLPLDETSPEYRELHPFGLIPTLLDGELTVTESNVALRYLAEREGRGDLRGETPADRARVDMVLDSLSLELRPALWAVECTAVYGESAPEAERATAVADLERALRGFDRLLDPAGPYALGGFTIADCALAGRVHHLARLPIDPDCAPRLRRALAATEARPAWTAGIDTPARSGTS